MIIQYFYPEKPTLLSVDQKLFTTLSESTDWIAEKKFNGIRLQLHRPEPGIWKFYGRHNNELVYTPSDELVESLSQFDKKLLTGYYLFDGELRHNKVIGVRHKIVIYDILICNGNLLFEEFWSRRNHLKEILDEESEPIRIPHQYEKDFRKVFNSFQDNKEVEGLVIKHLNGKLNIDRSSAQNSNWMFKARYPSGRHKF